jgi:hypothetical protein
MEIIIATVRDFYEHGYDIHGWCPKCQRFVDASLGRLIARGKGDRLLCEIRIRHACGSRVSIRVAAVQDHRPFDITKHLKR